MNPTLNHVARVVAACLLAAATRAGAQSATPAAGGTPEPRVVFRIRPTGDAREERRVLTLLATYLEPRTVAARAGASVFALIRGECGTAKEVHLELFRQLNPQVKGTVLEEPRTVALPPCPYWRTDARTVVPPSGSVASAVRLATGVAGPRTMLAMAAHNRVPAAYGRGVMGRTVHLPYAVLPATYALRAAYAGRAAEALAAIRAAPGAVAAGVDNGITDLISDVQPSGTPGTDCIGPVGGEAWPFSAPDVLARLHRNDQLRQRLGVGPRDTRRVLVGVADTGIELEESRLPFFTNSLELPEQGGVPDYDDDGNGYDDDVVGVSMPARRGPPEIEPAYSRRGHGTSVAGLVVGGVGSPELAREAGNRINLSIISLVERTSPPVVSDAAGQQHSFGFPEAGITRALSYGPNNQPLQILNISIQSPNEMATFGASLSSASVLVVAAAGNDRTNTDNYPRYPAYYVKDHRTKVITVTAHNALTAEQRLALRTGTAAPAAPPVLPPFTNRGRESVDLAAPGCMVESLDLAGTRGTFTGSSYAAPIVSFTAALLMSEGITSHARVKNRIMATVDVIPGLPVYSEGILNIDKALSVLEDVIELRNGQVLRGRILEPSGFAFENELYEWKNVLKVVPRATAANPNAARVFLRRTGDQMAIVEGEMQAGDVRFVDWTTGGIRILPWSDIVDLIPAILFRSSTLPQ